MSVNGDGVESFDKSSTDGEQHKRVKRWGWLKKAFNTVKNGVQKAVNVIDKKNLNKKTFKM